MPLTLSLFKDQLYRVQTSTMFFCSVLNQTCSLKSLLFLLLYWEAGGKTKHTSPQSETEKKEKKKGKMQRASFAPGTVQEEVRFIWLGVSSHIFSPSHWGVGGGRGN